MAKKIETNLRNKILNAMEVLVERATTASSPSDSAALTLAVYQLSNTLYNIREYGAEW